jgi:hypothetical protein
MYEHRKSIAAYTLGYFGSWALMLSSSFWKKSIDMLASDYFMLIEKSVKINKNFDLIFYVYSAQALKCSIRD